MPDVVRVRRAYDEEAASAEAALDFTDEVNLTRQEFKDDADINELVRRFGVTGTMPGPKDPPFYGDFSNVEDFHTAMLALDEADEAFMGLPSDLRDRFANDPGSLLEFLHDEGNRDEAVSLGLIPAPAAPVEPEPGPAEEGEAPDPTSS